MPDLIEDAIRSSVHDAEDGLISVPDAEGSDDTSADPVVEVSPSGVAEPVVEAVVPPPAADNWALKELEAAGIKAPKPGREKGRENSLPWLRLQPILDNVRKKLTAGHAAALKASEDKYTAAEAKAKAADFFDNLIASNPDGLMKELARIHPTLYTRFLQPATQPATTTATVPPTSVMGARPEPDATFPDGSKGYSPEQHGKLMDWHEAKAEERAVAKVTKEMETRFGPIEKRFKAQQVYDQQRPAVQAQIASAKKTWGKLFDDGEADIAAFMTANPKSSLDAACAQVLVPRTAAQRDTMRAEILKEIKARPAAAARTTSATPAPVVDDGDDANDPITMAIRKSIAGLR